MSKVFVVTTLYQEQGGKAVNSLIGVFTTEEQAGVALDNAFHKACDSLGIEELNRVSYYTECDSFHITDGDDETFFCDGNIEEAEQDTEYDDENPYLISEEEKKEAGERLVQVQSLKELIDTIQTNLDNNDEPTELIIRLNGNAVSRKLISFADEDDKFEVFNFIDDSTQILSEEELFDEMKTYIGKALQVGALYYVLN